MKRPPPTVRSNSCDFSIRSCVQRILQPGFSLEMQEPVCSTKTNELSRCSRERIHRYRSRHLLVRIKSPTESFALATRRRASMRFSLIELSLVLSVRFRSGKLGEHTMLLPIRAPTRNNIALRTKTLDPLEPPSFTRTQAACRPRRARWFRPR